MSPRVTAVIVTYRSRRTIGATLRSLAPSHDAGVTEVIVVDNESNDGTADYVRKSFPWVEVVESGGNLGFGRGCNLGFERVSTPYTLFLNPDATLSEEALRILLAFIDARPMVGMCGPAIREEDGELQVAGMLPTPTAVIRHAAGLGGYPSMREIEPGSAPFRTNWLCGAVLMARSDVLRAVGGFDPRFFLYFEETDLCRKVSDAGYELWAVGEALAEHECGGSTRQSGTSMAHQCISEHYYRSRYYYLVKHHGWLGATLAEVASIPLLAIKTGAKRALGRSEANELKERLEGPVLRLPDRV